MKPRIVSRTHYQVDEPEYLSLLCRHCVSGVRTSYRETVAQQLTQELRSRNKDFNAAAGAYAVDLAKSLGLITADHVLSDKGQLVNLFAEQKEGDWETQLSLSNKEQLLYFRIFLEGDGAALVFLVDRILRDGSLPPADGTWNTLATEMFAKVYSDYLAMTNNTSDRVALRTLRDKVEANGYTGKSGSHQMFIHVQSLYRIGLISRTSSGHGRNYIFTSSESDVDGPLHSFASSVPDIVALERTIQRNDWAETAASVFHLADSEILSGDADADILSMIIPYYGRIVSTGAPLCPLSTLIDAVQLELMAAARKLLRYDTVIQLLTAAQKENPKHIRFHVDRQGRPAFLKLSPEIVAATSH
jgi:hypothetical protein